MLLRELHDRDVVRLDPHGAIRAAYPFSAHPTPHVVHIADRPRVYAVCAIDALGIAAMLHRDITIDSTDPHNGQPISVTVHNGRSAPVGRVRSAGRGAGRSRCRSRRAGGNDLTGLARYVSRWLLA